MTFDAHDSMQIPRSVRFQLQRSPIVLMTLISRYRMAEEVIVQLIDSSIKRKQAVLGRSMASGILSG